MTLPTRTFGTTGLEITTVGFGAWAVGGSWAWGWGAQDDDDSVKAIRHAVERGVNWIDTAPAYGLGHSEEVVAKALAGLSDADRPYVFTKAGIVWDENDTSGETWRDMGSADVRRQVEGSLRRLDVERLDLLQVHWPAEADDGPAAGTPVEEYWQVLADLKAAGKIRHIGLSNHDVDQLDRAEKVAHVETLQPPFSAVNRDAADEIAWSAEHGTGVIVYSPMQSGLLTGAFSAERVASLAADDWRRTSADFTTGLAANLAVADALKPVAERHGVTQGAVAVAWALAWPGVTGAIVGARNPGQVDGWVPAGGVELTGTDLDEIGTAIGLSRV